MVWSLGIGLPARGSTLASGVRNEQGLEELTITKLDLEQSLNTLTTMASSIENRALNSKFVKVNAKGAINMNSWYWWLNSLFVKTDSGTGPYTHSLVLTDDNYRGFALVFSNGYNQGQVYNLICKRFQIKFSPREIAKFDFEGVGIYSTSYTAPDSTALVTHYTKPTLTINGSNFSFLDLTYTITHSNEAPTLTLDSNDDSNIMTGKFNVEVEGKLISTMNNTIFNSINSTIGSTNLTSTESTSNEITINLTNLVQKFDLIAKVGENYIYNYKGRNPTAISISTKNNMAT
ncbi:MAG: hypothetical protein QW156_03875 [Candidatus Aenigmatarchaeota archaeon]